VPGDLDRVFDRRMIGDRQGSGSVMTGPVLGRTGPKRKCAPARACRPVPAISTCAGHR
jgi:hypothetical protein